MHSINKQNSLFISWALFSVGVALIVFFLSRWDAPLISILITMCLLGCIAGFGARYLKKVTSSTGMIDSEKEFLKKELESLKKENAIITKELDFMKNQFNAHVIFNFLNFCYSKVHKSSLNAADAIEAFSDMLRYSLQIKPMEHVPLKKEIEYLENFIRVQKCLTTKVCINFQYEGQIHEKSILPRVLVTFVENAFKYGEINNELHPIEIYLFADSHQVIFNVKNKKSLAKRLEGLEPNYQNVKQMLDALYKDRYELKIKNTQGDYHSELVLEV